MNVTETKKEIKREKRIEKIEFTVVIVEVSY